MSKQKDNKSSWPKVFERIFEQAKKTGMPVQVKPIGNITVTEIDSLQVRNVRFVKETLTIICDMFRTSTEINDDWDYGWIEKEIQIKSPERFEELRKAHMVCKLSEEQGAMGYDFIELYPEVFGEDK